jgi:hypothetical protein
MRRPKSLHNLQHDEGGNYMAETENTHSSFCGRLPRSVVAVSLTLELAISDVCTTKLLNTPIQLGSQDVVVQIDESLQPQVQIQPGQATTGHFK